MCNDRRNAEGYADPTAYEAIERATSSRNKLASKVFSTIFNVAHLADYNVLSITIEDSQTGKTYTRRV